MTFVHCILCIAKKSLLKMAAVAAICKFHKSPFSNGIDRILGAFVVVHDNDDDEDHNATVGLSLECHGSCGYICVCREVAKSIY